MAHFHSNALIGAGGQGGAVEENIERSLRFNSGDSTSLTRTPSSASNRKTWTWAGWIKKSKFGENVRVFQARSGTSGDQTFIQFRTDNKIYVGGNSDVFLVNTDAVFRDPGAWGHLCVSFDTTQSTASDRIRIFWNGVQQDVSGTQPSQDYSTAQINTTLPHAIGGEANSNSEYFNGYLADIYLIDGSRLEPTSFGEYDDNGVWKAVGYGGGYGTNGFHLDFADAADLGDDNSGRGNDFTPNNLTGHATVQTYPGVAFDGPTNGASIATGYLSIPASNTSDFNFGTGDFTWEGFVLSYDWTGGSSNDDQQVLVHAPTGSSDISGLFVDGGQSYYYSNKNTSRFIITGPTLENGRWYHIAASRESGTLRLFVDGVSAGSASYTDNYADGIFTLGRNEDNDKNQFRGVISNFRVLKGTALYTSNFTVPTTPLTNITNTKLLCCQSSSSATTAAVSPGTIVANGDTNGTERSDSRASNDSLFDVPKNGDQSDTGAGGEVSANYPTLSPIDNLDAGVALSNGNLHAAVGSGTSSKNPRSTIFLNSGKWYWEMTVSAKSTFLMAGIATSSVGKSGAALNQTGGYGYGSGGNYYAGSGSVSDSSPASFTTGDVIGVKWDADAGTLEFYKNNSSQGTISSIPSDYYSPAFTITSGNDAFDVNFGQRAFVYSAPTNHKPICTATLPTPTIADGSDYFEAKTYTGNSSTNSITGLNFSTDFVWIKNRVDTDEHMLFDTIRGALNRLCSSVANSEASQANTLTAFNSDGFTLGSDGQVNQNTQTYISWNWDAGSSTVSNTDGSITASVRANQSAGFSIVSYTGDGSTTTWGHGLSAAPKFIMFKRRNNANNWFVLADVGVHSGFTIFEGLNNTNAGGDYSSNASASSTIVTLPNTTDWNTNGGTYIAYCFTPVSGYSAFGSYEGNGSSDGPFVALSFKPRFVLYKESTNNGSGHWNMYDTARDTYNVVDANLQANRNVAEFTFTAIDILSNGFKLRTSNSTHNHNGGTYVYMAFAENPFQANGGLAR